jgi:hypothetical protein
VGARRERLALLVAERRLGVPVFMAFTAIAAALLGDGRYALRSTRRHSRLATA